MDDSFKILKKSPKLLPYTPVLGRRPHLGRGKVYKSLLNLARSKSIQGLQQLIDIASNEETDVRVRVVAWGMVLDRAWGKPKENADDTATAPPPDLTVLNREELQQLVSLTQKIKNASPVITDPDDSDDEHITVDM